MSYDWSNKNSPQNSGKKMVFSRRSYDSRKKEDEGKVPLRPKIRSFRTVEKGVNKG